MSGSREGAAAPVWRVALTLPEHLLGAFEAALEEGATDISTAVSAALLHGEGEIEESRRRLWRLSAYCAGATEGAAVAALLTETAARLGVARPEMRGEAVPDEDWAAGTGRAFPLVFAGRFVVHGDHSRPPPGRTALRIDAADAFGSGAHGSTRGCLLALDRLANKQRVRAALDLGSGSGVLAVAIAKSWRGGAGGRAAVLAADIDPAAVARSRAAAEANGVSDAVRTCPSDGFAAAEIAAGAPYDLICANILANPLRRMAPALARHLAPGGVAILSGLLTSQEEDVLESYRRAGLRLADRIGCGDWATLILTD